MGEAATPRGERHSPWAAQVQCHDSTWLMYLFIPPVVCSGKSIPPDTYFKPPLGDAPSCSTASTVPYVGNTFSDKCISWSLLFQICLSYLEARWPSHSAAFTPPAFAGTKKKKKLAEALHAEQLQGLLIRSNAITLDWVVILLKQRPVLQTVPALPNEPF